MTNRSFPRLKKRLLVEFEDAAGTRHTAYTKDFSLTGLFVVSDARPAPGDPQTVKVHLPRAAVELAMTRIILPELPHLVREARRH